jgi:tRNA(His) 5'-end guanylyltransferase
MPERQRAACPQFDCRVFSVPNETEAANCLLWRELDATRNSVSMAAQANFSHKELQGKSCAEMHDMLFNKSINWNNYPDFFKRGTYVQRINVVRPFTVEEIDKLPPKHMARTNPNLTVERTDYIEIKMPPFMKVINRENVIFRGESPKTLGTDDITCEESF